MNTRLFLPAACGLLLVFQLAAQDGPANTEAEYKARYEERIKKERLHGVYIPRNLDDVFLQLDGKISAEAKATYKSIFEDSICSAMHARLGQWMITNWSFYEGSRLSHYLRSAGVTYPDDMADFLLIAYHKHLNGKPVEIKPLVVSFREKRKKEWEEEKKEGKVIKEEVRKTTPPAKPETPPAPAKPAADTQKTNAKPPAKPAGKPTAGAPKGNN